VGQGVRTTTQAWDLYQRWIALPEVLFLTEPAQLEARLGRIARSRSLGPAADSRRDAPNGWSVGDREPEDPRRIAPGLAVADAERHAPEVGIDRELEGAALQLAGLERREDDHLALGR